MGLLLLGTVNVFNIKSRTTVYPFRFLNFHGWGHLRENRERGEGRKEEGVLKLY